ncbi:MAG: isoamylase early set domain-containing protein [bacterium]|nr:isoamylase early set domain-containing protein [bacterium]
MATNKSSLSSSKSASKTTTNRPKKKRVIFTFYSPQANNVSLVGDFNNWDYTQSMKKDKDGTWKAKLELEPGRYEYRLLVDGEWQNDPNCHNLVPNQFGTQNCILEVSN